MALVPGTHLGPYEILVPLGAGGMGEVYRAKDPRLDREVAVKVLPESFARDPERVARFQREAKLLASLNHSNIAAIYGFEEHRLETGATRFLVLECVEGQTLADRLKTGPLPVDEALGVCKQIAEALEAAHEHGVIHRDLKPGNVKVTPDGKVKVLDFGLAKAFAGDVSATDIAHSPTITAEHTAKGVVLGTAAYMSPEQARGKPLDKRTDIWSFGCVLYECLAGQRAFAGETTSDITAKILERDPDYGVLPANTPPAIRHLLHHCLEKDRAHRLRDIGDARLEMEEAISTRAWSTTAIAAAAAVPAYEKRRRRLFIAVGITFILGMVIGVELWSLVGRRLPSAQGPSAAMSTSRLSIVFPLQLHIERVHLSPDGQALAFIAREEVEGAPRGELMIYTRRLDSYDVAPLRGTQGAIGFAFSPDSKWLAFVAPISAETGKKQLAKIPADGSSPPLTLTDWRDEWRPVLAWLPGGDILLMTRMEPAVVRVPSSGGPPKPPQKIDTGPFANFIHSGALPTDAGVLLEAFSYGERGFQLSVVLLDLETVRVRALIDVGGRSAYSPTGHIVFTRSEKLLAAPFDLDRLEITGAAVALAGGLLTEDAWSNAWFDIAANGTLVYAPGGRVGARRRIALVDQIGQVEAWSDERRAFDVFIQASRDGRRVAVVVANASGNWEMWVSDIGRPRLRRLAAVPEADCFLPVWSPDGERIAYARWSAGEQDGVYRRRADGSDVPARLLKADARGVDVVPYSWSPDGSVLLVQRLARGKGTLLLVPAEQEDQRADEVKPLLGTPFNEMYGAFSPDGRWIAYVSDESGRQEVYVCPYDSKECTVGTAVQVSAAGAQVPFRWAADGRTLFYADQSNRLMAVAVAAEPTLTASAPQPACDLAKLGAAPWDTGPEQSLAFDVLPDGRFVIIQKGEDEGRITRCNVVLNWFEELKQRVPAGTR